jgi:hypothetical protein
MAAALLLALVRGARSVQLHGGAPAPSPPPTMPPTPPPLGAAPLPSAATSLGELIEQDGNTTYALGVLYVVSAIYAVRRFLWLWRSQRRPGWDAGKLFVASIFFACLVRSLSFVTLAVLAFENVAVVSAGGGGRTQEQEFYHRVLAILFNVGDWAAISTYLLLVVRLRGPGPGPGPGPGRNRHTRHGGVRGVC